MSDLHIDDFCRDTARALSMLYQKFPQKIILYVEDIAGADTPDEFGLHSPRFLAAFNALLWLAETDYIQFRQTIRQEAIEDATLTHRCFTFLSGPAAESTSQLFHSPDPTPDSNTDSNPGIDPAPVPRLPRRIDLLRDTLASKSSDQLKALILAFMQESRQYQ